MIPLSEQISAVQRQLSTLTDWVYPRRIERGVLTAEDAEAELARLRAAVESLEHLETLSACIRYFGGWTDG